VPILTGGWKVTRSRGEIRVDLTQARSFEHDDTDAIASAVEDHLGDPDVRAIRLDGPVLMENEMPRGLTSMDPHLGLLARTRGIELRVGPSSHVFGVDAFGLGKSRHGREGGTDRR
jgi:hypothetical protein